MRTIRAILFYMGMSIWTVCLAIIYFPFCYILPPEKLNRVSYYWAYGSLTWLRICCGISYQVIGKEHLAHGSNIIVSNHQSSFETLVFHVIAHNCSFVLKKELRRIPFFGFYLSRIGMVIIDRAGGASTLKEMIKQVKHCVSKKRDIIIFPEGTRIAVGEERPYQPGVVALYTNKALAEYPIIPVAHNAGLYWPKNTLVKNPGKITIEIMPAMVKGMEKEVFLSQLQSTIREKTHELVAQHKSST